MKNIIKHCGEHKSMVQVNLEEKRELIGNGGGGGLWENFTSARRQGKKARSMLGVLGGVSGGKQNCGRVLSTRGLNCGSTIRGTRGDG